jgi:hypothetical protein
MDLRVDLSIVLQPNNRSCPTQPDSARLDQPIERRPIVRFEHRLELASIRASCRRPQLAQKVLKQQFQFTSALVHLWIKHGLFVRLGSTCFCSSAACRSVSQSLSEILSRYRAGRRRRVRTEHRIGASVEVDVLRIFIPKDCRLVATDTLNCCSLSLSLSHSPALGRLSAVTCLASSFLHRLHFCSSVQRCILVPNRLCNGLFALSVPVPLLQMREHVIMRTSSPL